jgi:hypothetical protein
MTIPILTDCTDGSGKSNPGFVQAIDIISALKFKNIMILHIREDDVLEGYIETQRTENVKRPHELMLMGAAETLIRHRMASQGKDAGKLKQKEWDHVVASVLHQTAQEAEERNQEEKSPDPLGELFKLLVTKGVIIRGKE